MIVGLFVFGCLTMNAPAAEIITIDDFEQKIVTKEHLTKTADNVIILFDASVSMAETYKDSGKSRYELAKTFLEDGNNRMPDLGYNLGIYLYTPWTPIYLNPAVLVGLWGQRPVSSESTATLYCCADLGRD